jgi:transcriptional regulator with XRE-family HTH domain
MSRTIQSPRHRALAALIAEERKKARLTQAVVAKRLGRHQSFVATVESGQRRIDVIELIEFGAAIGFDPSTVITTLVRAELPS